jgi:type IV pilus assembly protein PilA
MNIKSIKKNIKKNKAFTLIELLVVVAIIGILASVGTVAYNGYTAAAQEAAARTKHNTIVKYIGSEMARCLVSGGDTRIIANNGFPGVTCTGRTGMDAIGALVTAGNFLNFGNPYDDSVGVIRQAATGAATVLGSTTIFDNQTQVEISTLVVGTTVLNATVMK